MIHRNSHVMYVIQNHFDSTLTSDLSTVMIVFQLIMFHKLGMFHLVLVILQQFVLSVIPHPQTLVLNKLAFLQLHRQVLQPVRHEQEIISQQHFGIESWIIRTGRNLLSSVLLHPIVTGSGSGVSEQCACFQTSF